MNETQLPRQSLRLLTSTSEQGSILVLAFEFHKDDKVSFGYPENDEFIAIRVKPLASMKDVGPLLISW